VAEEARLEVFQEERFAEKRIREQIDLTDGEIVGGAPVCVNLAQFFCGEGLRRGSVCRACSGAVRHGVLLLL
jgi:hypothetical protein